MATVMDSTAGPAVVGAVKTPYGILSRSAAQNAWVVQVARRRIPPDLQCLTDEDVVWLLLRGWRP